MSRHAAPSPGAPRDHRSRIDASFGAETVSAAELIARHRLARAAATLPPGEPTVGPAVLAAIPPREATVVPASELIARFRSVSAPTGDRFGAGRHQAHPRVGSVPRPAAHRTIRPERRELNVLTALRPSKPIVVVVRPVLVAAAVVATVVALDAPNLRHSSNASADQPQNAGEPVRPSSSAPSPPPVANVGGPPATSTATPSGRSIATAPIPKVDTPALGRIAPGATATRISRDRRTSRPAAKPLTKPGQTVPGIWVLPNGGPETSCFCMRWGVMHAGIDLAGPLGSPILSVGDGVVIKAGPADGFGNAVVVQHGNGDISLYGHMAYYFVQVGEKVKAGQKIALVGNEGFSTGPHLHFEVHLGGFDGPPTDPVPWLRERGITVGDYNPNG